MGGQFKVELHTAFCLKVSLRATDDVFYTLIFIKLLVYFTLQKLHDQGQWARNCHGPASLGPLGPCINPRLVSRIGSSKLNYIQQNSTVYISMVLKNFITEAISYKVNGP